MTAIAEVRLWGSRIAAVAMGSAMRSRPSRDHPAFLASSIEVSPLVMPLRAETYSFPGLALESFHGLPGLVADSLPDRYGQALIDAWLAAQGRTPESFNAVERLCYVGQRGMGALEFRPSHGPRPPPRTTSRSPRSWSSHPRSTRAGPSSSHHSRGPPRARDARHPQRRHLRRRARAKAVIAFNPATQAVRSGQVDLEPGFEYWLLKFDGVTGNRDKDTLADPRGYGAIEYAYSLMAHDAGIEMTECRLLEEGGRRHFMTRRFDRRPDGEKLHMQSLGALAHFDFNRAGAHSYEQAFAAMHSLGLPHAQVEQLFRRMTFNIVARNQDDHVKNIAFLMDRAGTWHLAPAFDMTYAYRPESRWTGRHQMTMNGKADDFTRADFEACGRVARLPSGRALRILDELRAVVSGWSEYAERAGVDDDHVRRIAPALRLEIPRD